MANHNFGGPDTNLANIHMDAVKREMSGSRLI